MVESCYAGSVNGEEYSLVRVYNEVKLSILDGDFLVDLFEY